jgi:septal ring factor EnvC (AmiA/AmiB activator)
MIVVAIAAWVLAESAAGTPVLDSLRGLDERIRALESSIDGLRTKLSTGEREVSRLTRDEIAMERRVAEHRQATVGQVRALHRLVPRANVGAGLAPFEEAKFVASMRRVIAAERGEIARATDLAIALSNKRRAVAAERTLQATRHADLVQERDRLARERDARLSLVSRVSRDRAFGAQARLELSTAEGLLDRAISGLPGGADASPTMGRRAGLPFARHRRRLPPPCDGAIEVPFGPRFDDEAQMAVFHKGIDIRAKDGTPVRAIFDGTVVFTGIHPGYGDIIIVDHGDEYSSLAAHLSRTDVRIGDAVTLGQTIGAVGDSGSFKGAYLYFEIRHKSRPVNPLLWFRRGARN